MNRYNNTDDGTKLKLKEYRKQYYNKCIERCNREKDFINVIREGCENYIIK